MSVDAAKLQRSFKQLSANGDALIARFYHELFQRRPEMAELFKPVSLHEQRRKFLFALSFVARNIDKPDILNIYLGGLGATHIDYGVTEAAYPLLIDCLLIALSEAAGDTWTPDTEQLWRDTLNTIASLMIAGVNKPPLVCGPPLPPS